MSRRLNDVIGLRKMDCDGLAVTGPSWLALLALLFFLERWSDGDSLSVTRGARAS